jgi:hypothetical protein
VQGGAQVEHAAIGQLKALYAEVGTAHHQGDQRRLRPPLKSVQAALLRRVRGDAVGMVMVRPPY